MIGRIFGEIKRRFISSILITILIMTVVNYAKIIDVESVIYYGNPVAKLIERNRAEKIIRQFEYLRVELHLTQQAVEANQRIIEAQNELILSNQMLLEKKLIAIEMLIR